MVNKFYACKCVHVFCILQVFVKERKLFSLADIDHNLEQLNLRGMDSDKPSSLINADLSPGGSLKQHGKHIACVATWRYTCSQCSCVTRIKLSTVFCVYSFTDVDACKVFTLGNCTHATR